MGLSKNAKIALITSSVVVGVVALGVGLGLGLDFKTSDTTTGLQPITNEEGEKFYNDLPDLPRSKKVEEIIKRTPIQRVFCDTFEVIVPTQQQADERLNEYLHNYQVINKSLKLSNQIKTYCWRIRDVEGTDDQLGVEEIDKYLTNAMQYRVEMNNDVTMNSLSNEEAREALDEKQQNYFLNNKIACHTSKNVIETDKSNATKNLVKDFLRDAELTGLANYEPVGYPIVKNFDGFTSTDGTHPEYCFRIKLKEPS